MKLIGANLQHAAKRGQVNPKRRQKWTLYVRRK